MKYVLLFTGTKEGERAWETMPEAQRNGAMAQVDNWFQKHASKVRGGFQLQPERTATTVRFNNGKPVVTDGPFIEGKESIGGYAEVDVADLDEAIAMAKEWPTLGPVEVRPVVDRGEAHAVELHQSGLGAEPEVPVVGLDDRIDPRIRQTLLHLPDAVNRLCERPRGIEGVGMLRQRNERQHDRNAQPRDHSHLSIMIRGLHRRIALP